MQIKTTALAVLLLVTALAGCGGGGGGEGGGSSVSPSIKPSKLHPLRTRLFRLQPLHRARVESPARRGKNKDPVNQNDQC